MSFAFTGLEKNSFLLRRRHHIYTTKNYEKYLKKQDNETLKQTLKNVRS